VNPRLKVRLGAAALALTAAFLWSTYYLFVLGVSPAARPSAVLFYPFLGGGAGYAAWVIARGEGSLLARSFAQPSAYARVGLLLVMQLSVLAATYLTGPVDASLLSLLGDIVVTPLVVALLVAGNRAELGTPWFVAGAGLSIVGGTLAIAGGRGPSAIHDLGWLVVVGVPLSVAFFFVLSARAGTKVPLSVVVAQSMLAAAVGSCALAPLLPGGVPGVLTVSAAALLLLLVNGLVSFFLAPLLYFRSIESAGLVFPPMLMTGIPVFTLLLSAVVLGLSPPLLGVLGVPVAAAGGVLALVAGARGSSTR